MIKTRNSIYFSKYRQENCGFIHRTHFKMAQLMMLNYEESIRRRGGKIHAWFYIINCCLLTNFQRSPFPEKKYVYMYSSSTF